MKILSVSFTGFGPYRKRQTVDFTAFEEAGLFLIAGDTGAGKSTILDAIVFALYDHVPRFDGKSAEARSRFARPDEPTEVTVEFSHQQHEYRVTRSPQYLRPKRRGQGEVLQKAEQTLSIRRNGEWEVLAVKAADVANQLREIFPLSAPQFLQVMLLAQGKFQQFLHATSKERQQLLRTLFATHRFDAFGELAKHRAAALQARTNEAQSALQELRAQLLTQANTDATTSNENDTDEPDTSQALTIEFLDARLRKNQTVLALAQQHYDQVSLEFERAAAVAHDLKQTQRDQIRRNEHRDTLERLRGEAAIIELEVRQPLNLDAQATPLLQVLDEVDNRSRDAQQHRHDVAAACAQFVAKCEPLNGQQRAELDVVAAIAGCQEITDALDDPAAPIPDTGVFEAALESLTATEHALSEAATLEDEISQLTGELADIKTRVDAKQEALVEASTRRERLPKQIDSDRARITQLAEQLATLDVTRQELERATVRRDAASGAMDAEQALLQAREHLQHALTRHEEAIAAERSLIADRLANSAVILAQSLAPQSPCPVCGAQEHPNPATGDGDPVTDHDLEAAAAATSSAQEQVVVARRAADAAKSKHNSLLERAEHNTVEACDADIARLTEIVSSLEEFAAERSKLETRVRHNQQQLDQAELQINELRQELTECTRSRDIAQTKLDESTRRSTALTGTFESIRGKLDTVKRLRSCTVLVRDQLLACRTARNELDRANAAAASRVSESPFADASEIRAATLEASDRDRLTTRLTTYTAQLDAARAYLEREDVCALPEAIVDTTSAQEHADAVFASRDEAARARFHAQNVSESEQQIISRAKHLLGAQSSELAEYEQWQRLADDLRGNNDQKLSLEAFVLAAYLEEILDAANVRLQQTTQARYELVLDDSRGAHSAQSGLGINILDCYNGKRRPSNSLSGGETFLVSLALALGLADVVSHNAGGLTLETLFIDEGFGSLDPQTLEVAMQTLDHLRNSGRTVGVISHVQAMHDRIPARIEVQVLDDRSSTLSTSGVG